jgi:hypothetical protein
MRLTYAAAAVVSVLSIGMHSASSFATPPGNLQGSWRVTVRPTLPITVCNGPVIAPAPAPFLELANYGAGGVMSETNAQLNFTSAGVSPGFPFNASDGYGAWKVDNGHTTVKFTKLLFDVTGHDAGEADLMEDLDVSGDSLSGAFTIKFNFLNNSPSLCSGGTVTAPRVAAQ